MFRASVILVCVLAPFVVFSQYYVKEYTYNASDNESKLDANRIALKEVKRLLIEEMGVYINTSTTLYKRNDISQIDIETKTRVISECITKTNILEEKWDGYYYYVKVQMYVDKNDMENRLRRIASSQKPEPKIVYVTTNTSTKKNKKKIDLSNESLYGAFNSSYNINSNSVSLGLAFGVLVDNRFIVGIFGLTNVEHFYSNTDAHIRYNGKGLFFEPVFFSSSSVSLSIPLYVGSGTISQFEGKFKRETDNYFYFEPGVNLAITVANNVRLSAGVGYKVADVELPDTPDNILSGLTLKLAVSLIN